MYKKRHNQNKVTNTLNTNTETTYQLENLHQQKIGALLNEKNKLQLKQS